MGNWTSKAEIRKWLESIRFNDVPVYKETLALESANKVLQKKGRLVALGFDVLQMPRYKIVYTILDSA